MGYYIQTPDHFHKAEYVLDNYGAISVTRKEAIEEFYSGDFAVLCCACNGRFEALAVVHNEYDLSCFTDPRDYRLKKWLVMEKKIAYDLAGIKEEDT